MNETAKIKMEANVHDWPTHQRIMSEQPPTMRFEQGMDPIRWQSSLRRELSRVLGMDAMPTPPAASPVARTLWTRDHPRGQIHKLMYEVEPGQSALAYLCLPHHVEPPYPVVICLQGHSTGMHKSINLDPQEHEPITTEGDRDFGIQAMAQGYAALCLEQRSFGQRRETQIGTVKQDLKPTCLQSSMNALLLGRTMIGQRVYDVQRTIDYLASRNDLDLDQLGCMGNSGGGTVTIYAAALDSRIRWAMPASAFCAFDQSIMPIQHCVCNYVPGIRRLAEMGELAGLIAPRPLVIVHGQDDSIFPLAGVQTAFNNLRPIYDAFEASSWCELVVGPGAHRFYAELAWAAQQRALRAARESNCQSS